MKVSKILKNKSSFLAMHDITKLNSLENPRKKYPIVWSKIFYKDYSRYPAILLPVTRKIENKNLFDILLKRESTRKFSRRKISLEDLSTLLFFSGGINRIDHKSMIIKRMYPSGGARYPLETYVLVFKDSNELKKGIYHYNVKHHALELIKKGNFSYELKEIGGGVNRKIIVNCNIIIIVTAVFGRTEIKYGKSSYRIIMLEGGNLAQNIYLVSTALELGCCLIGGFIDNKINALLDLDIEKEQTLYLVAVGNK